MNSFDYYILSLLNKYAQCCIIFDSITYMVSYTNLLKGGVVVAMLWYAWFAHPKDIEQQLSSIVATFTASFFSLMVVRGLAIMLPFRLRPIHNPMLEFKLPFSVHETIFDGWNSFPSDHAALFYALMVSIFFLSRKLGIISLVYISIVISFPRVYLGLHYPSDMIVGGLIGICFACLFHIKSIKEFISRPVYIWQKKYPGLFYACFFLLSYQVVDLFTDVRKIGSVVYEMLRYMLSM